MHQHYAEGQSLGSLSLHPPQALSVHAAAIRAPVIMMSPNRQDKKNRLRNGLDFDVKRRAQAEIQNLSRKLNLVTDKLGDLDDLLRESVPSPVESNQRT
jgi:CRP/FNR family transcriptional regulator, cyclic AMP receptor protein